VSRNDATRVFSRAIQFTLWWETGGDLERGAPHTDPEDVGGFTCWGLAQRFHPMIDVASLTRAQAEAYYFENYWRRGQCHKMRAPVAVAHFDCFVNRPPEKAVGVLQHVVGAVVDGELGSRTLAALDYAILHAEFDPATQQSGAYAIALRLVDRRCDENIRKWRRENKWTHVEGLASRWVALAALVATTPDAITAS